MPSFAITRSSTVQCEHVGSISAKGVQSKLKVAGSFALVDGDLTGASVTSCPNPDDSSKGLKKCSKAQKQSDGVATKLKVEGKAVLLVGTKGQTDGLTASKPATYSVISAGQTKLKAD